MIHGFLGSFLGRYLIGGVLSVVVVGGLYGVVRHSGYSACQRDQQAALVASIQRAQEQAREIALQDAEVALDTIRTIQQIRTVEKVITVEVQNEIPTDCRACAITPRARGLLNDALSGLHSTPADPGKPPGTMPTPDSPPYRELPGSRFQGGGGISKTL